MRKSGSSVHKTGRTHFDVCLVLAVPSFYMNVGHFSEYSGHPNNKFQTFLKNSREEIADWLFYTTICVFQCRFHQKSFNFFGPVFA